MPQLTRAVGYPLQAGYFVFPSVIQPRSFARLDISADFDDEIPEPSTDGKVSQKLKTILGFTDEWAKTPDYQRARPSLLVWSSGQHQRSNLGV